MQAENAVMGLFQQEDQAVAAIEALKDSPWSIQRVHSPIPSHKIAHALDVGKSRIGYFTLAGGIIGFFAGFLLAAFTATQWNIMVSGKPIVALVPFFIVGFEFTILFAIFGNVAGMIHQMKLPEFKGLEMYDPRCSGDHYGIVAACNRDRRGELEKFFREKGGEVRVFE
jgi:Alternative complex III, ActD subunit